MKHPRMGAGEKILRKDVEILKCNQAQFLWPELSIGPESMHF